MDSVASIDVKIIAERMLAGSMFFKNKYVFVAHVVSFLKAYF